MGNENCYVLPPEKAISVDVVEIYPNTNFRLTRKLKEQGTCHVILRIGELNMEIKNIRYRVRTNGGMVARPIEISVPTITFEDSAIFDKIKEVVEIEVLKTKKTLLRLPVDFFYFI